MASPRPSHASRARSVAGIVLACLAAGAVGIAGAIALAGGRPDADGTPSAEAPTASAPAQATLPPNAADMPMVPPPIKTVPTVKFSLIAAGDVLPHQPVMASAKSGKGWDFTPLMAPTQPFIEGADIALCHMEVPVAPEGTKPSGYPTFGAPPTLPRDLAAVGWDGCSTASNHSVDRGFPGIVSTLDAFQAAGLGHAGTARSEKEATQIQYYTVFEDGRTVQMAHISYAYGLNGLPVPKGKPWSVNTFDMANADVTPILNAAKDARERGVDIVVASVHCCVEYATAPGGVQQQIAQKIADSGLVDLYIGHHAHVPQPIRLLPGGPGGKGMWVAYGLGNYVSNQDGSTVGVAETASGVMLSATFTVSPTDDVDVSVGWTAVTVDRTGGHKVYPITESTGKVGTLSASTVKSRWQLVANAVGTEAPEVTAPGTVYADYVTHNTRLP